MTSTARKKRPDWQQVPESHLQHRQDCGWGIQPLDGCSLPGNDKGIPPTCGERLRSGDEGAELQISRPR